MIESMTPEELCSEIRSNLLEISELEIELSKYYDDVEEGNYDGDSIDLSIAIEELRSETRQIVQRLKMMGELPDEYVYLLEEH